MKKLILIIIAILTFHGVSVSQVTQQWVKRYNGGGSDYAQKVLVDKFTGDVYVTGSSMNTSGNQDFLTIKYNSSGVQKWIRTYNGTGNSYDGTSDMVLDNLGNVIITGSSRGAGSQQDIVTIKYDQNGNRLWVKRYNGTANASDVPLSITVDMQANVIVTGKSMGMNGATSTSFDILTIKYDYFGNEDWVQRYNGIDNSIDEAFSVTVDDNNNVYLAGYSYSNLTSNDLTAIKYSSQGSPEWIKKHVTSGIDAGWKILNNSQAQEIYVTGKSDSKNALLCYDYQGNVKWQALDYGGLFEMPMAALNNQGRILLCNSTALNGTADFMVIVVNPALGGGPSWFDIYNGPGGGADFPYAITVDNQNNFYVTGYSQSAGSGIDYATLKYNMFGSRVWEKRYNNTGTSANIPVSIDTDDNGNVYVTGYSQNLSGDYDFATIKYSQGLILGRNSVEVPAEFKLHQNYPNPFNPSTNIIFDIPKDSDVKIAVFDMLGREVQVLAIEFKQAGSYEVNFDASGMASGTYFYKLTAGSFTDVKKMILIK